MATLKKVNPNPVLSVKTQATPGAGMASVFGAIADSLGTFADYMMPGAIDEMERRGAEEGYQAAQGNSSVRMSSRSGLTGDIGKFGDAIASVESGGDYSALGPVTKNGDRAYGRYQVMGQYVPDWTERWYGRRLTPDEFLSNTAAQDSVFQGQFGSYVDRYGNPQDAASAWFTGQPLSAGGGRSDGYITGNEYVDRFNSYLSAPDLSRGGYKATVDFELEGKSRPNKPNQGVIDMLGLAADATFGEGSRVVIYSGKEHEGEQAGAPNRHPSGNAADVRVYDADGNLVKLDDPRALTFAQNARRFGAQSIGAGSEYMGDAFHIDMLGPDQRDPGQGSYWGSWAQANAGSIFGIPVGNNAPQSGTVVTTKEGRNEPKLYSPYSGPVLRAHNSAAELAYNAEILNQSETAFQAMRNNFPLDPVGFQQAAKAYVDDVISNAPSQFRAGLRESLNSTVARNQASIMGAQQADTRQRANNASAALTTRLSTQYSEAIAAGDTEGANALRAELDQVLRARENLPGASWTSEQSANVVWEAQRAADKIVERNRTDQNREWKSTLDTIVKAAKDGMTAGDEAILQNPDVWTALPSEAAEAQAYITLRDNFPEFFQMPPEVAMQMAQAVQDTPVQEGWEVDVANAAIDVAKANKLAWEKDPIKRASEVMDTKPSPMPTYAPGEEQAFIEWLKSRKDYGYGLRDGGYTDKPVFLSEDETKAVSELLAKGADPALRATAAGLLVAGLGSDAVGLFDSLKIDNVTRTAGKMMAIGGNEKTAMMAMQGQAMIAEGLVDLPTDKVFKSGMSTKMAAAFQGIPGGIEAQGQVLDYAQAIYAAQAQGVDPASTDAVSLMEQSIQMALGQDTNTRGVKTGGIQKVMDFETLLPMGVSAADVTTAFQKATTVDKADVPLAESMMQSVTDFGMNLLGFDQPDTLNEEIWTAAAGSLPMLGGVPMSVDDFEKYGVRFVPDQGPFYRLEIYTANGPIVADDANGNVMMVDLKAMIEAAQ